MPPTDGPVVEYNVHARRPADTKHLFASPLETDQRRADSLEYNVGVGHGLYLGFCGRLAASNNREPVPRSLEKLSLRAIGGHERPGN